MFTQISNDHYMTVIERKKLFLKTTVTTLDMKPFGTPEEVRHKTITITNIEDFDLLEPWMKYSIILQLEKIFNVKTPLFGYYPKWWEKLHKNKQEEFTFTKYVILIEEIIWKQSEKRKSIFEKILKKDAPVQPADNT